MLVSHYFHDLFVLADFFVKHPRRVFFLSFFSFNFANDLVSEVLFERSHKWTMLNLGSNGRIKHLEVVHCQPHPSGT